MITNKISYSLKSKLKSVVFLLAFVASIQAFAQEDLNESKRYFNNTVMFTAGSASMYDTYLSPIDYKGFSVGILYERIRDTYWFSGRFRKQQLMSIDFARGNNIVKNNNEYSGRLHYQIGGHYTFKQNDILLLNDASHLRLGIGGFWDINTGVLYNERNNNNPATARGYSNFNLSFIASLTWKKYAIRWQLGTPFMGILFATPYGQSYYELSLGNTSGVVHFASLHNQRALKNFITIDIPINNFMLRVGYLGDYYQTKVSGNITHHYTHSFVVGFPIQGLVKSKKKTSNIYWE